MGGVGVVDCIPSGTVNALIGGICQVDVVDMPDEEEGEIVVGPSAMGVAGIAIPGIWPFSEYGSPKYPS